MKILWLRPAKPDNISVGRHMIAEVLRRRGYEVEVRNVTLWSFIDVLSMNPDVVVGTTRLGAFVGAWKKLLSGTPLVVDHIDPISQLRRNNGPVKTWIVDQIEKVAFIIADHVLVVYREELPRVDRYARRVTKTDLGVDFERFADPNLNVRRQVGSLLEGAVSDDRRTVVYIGGLEPEYHVSTVISAMDHLSGWQFLVFGDGSERELLEEAAANRDDVVYLGTIGNDLIPGVLYEADVGICLLDDKNTLKILEYGAARLPAVNVEGDAESKYTGLITFCSLDPADVARAIEEAAMSATLDEYQSYVSSFGWESIASTYESVIKSAAAEDFGPSGSNPP